MKRKLTLKQYKDVMQGFFPVHKPVIVRVNRLKDEGSCAETAKRFYVTINRELSLSEQKDVLQHEWAHMKAGWTTKQQHTDVWGVWYARIYRKMYEEE